MRRPRVQPLLTMHLHRVVSILALPVLIPGLLFAQGPSPRIGITTPGPEAARYGMGTRRPSAPQEPFRTWGWGNGFGFGVFGGELDLKRSVKSGGQSLAGATAGVYFGRGTVLRGYYWKGVNDSWDDTEPIQSYGGEAQFDFLGTGPVQLFLLAGGGYLDFQEGYTNEDQERPKDTGLAIGGGGLIIELFKWMRLDLTLRDYLIKVPLGIEGSDAPLEGRTLKSNLMLTGGVTFRLGGTPGSEKPPSAQAAAAAAYAGQPTNAAVIPIPIDGGEIKVTYRGRDSALAAALGIPVDSATRIAIASAAAAEAIRIVLISELGYLDALYPESAQLGKPRAPITGERLDTLTRRLRLRVNEVFDHLAVMEASAIRLTLAQELAKQNVTGDAADRILAGTEPILAERVQLLQEDSRTVRAREDSLAARLQAELARRPAGIAYTGPGFGGDFQWVFGGQVALHSPARDLAIVPEAALGFGSGTSALIGVNGHYTLSAGGTTRPYVGLGVSLLVLSQPLGDLEGSSLVFTPKFGVTIESKGAQKLFGDRATGWMVEYQGVDFFSLNRLLFGVRWRL